MSLSGEFMVIWIFYAICGLGILFFAAFFLQCCLLSSRNHKHIIRQLSISDLFPSAQQARLLAQWEKEMAEFTARQGRSTARLFLIAASSAALLGFNPPSAHSGSIRTQFNPRASFGARTAQHRLQGEQIPCKKN